MVRKKQIQENHFDRGKIFYPFVMNYIASVHGFNDLVSRALIRKIGMVRESQGQDKVDELMESINIKNEDTRNHFKEMEKPAPLIGETEFRRSDNKKVKIEMNEIEDEIFNNGVYLTSNLHTAACILTISAYERSKSWDNQEDPIWNFFYHCRNASAHNNKFRIRSNRFPAKWRGHEITKELNGQILFKDKMANEPFLEFGDVITLLWDVEQKHQSMIIK